MRVTVLVILCILLNFSISFKFSQIVDYSTRGFHQIITKFGDKLWVRNSSSAEEEAVVETQYSDITQQSYKAALDTVLDITKNPQRQKQFLQCKKGPKAQFFKFGAVDVGYVGNRSTYQTILLDRRPDDCFDKVIVNFTNLRHNTINTVQVEMIAIGRRKQFCTESYIFATSSKLHVHSLILRNRHKFTWRNLNQLHYSSIVTWGIHIFRHCDSLNHKFPDIFKTLQVFAGGLGKNPNLYFFGSKPPLYMQKLNAEFIEAGTNYKWKQRNPKYINLSSYQVKSGDFLAITRMDGLDQIIQYGSGSHAGHSALVLEVDGVMSVVESTDGWYWPKRGIQRNDWETWKKWAMNADFSVVVLPLTEQSRKKFNVTAAQQFFKSKQGLPYGYHNFLFGWIDTPKDNYPPVLDPDFVFAGFSWLERIYEYPINRIMTQGLNKRLGTKGKNLGEIGVQIAKKNMTFGDLMAIPQKDGWLYNDGQSYVCGAFVAAVYQAGGLLNDIQGTQFTPKDIYTLTIFDRNYNVPKKCKSVDPTLPYCQIMGRWLMQLPGYSTIEPYPHMAQRCPTLAPDYFRPDGC